MSGFTYFVSFLFLAASFASTAALDPIKLQLIEELLETVFIPSNHVTGMSISIVESNETVFAKGYGYQNIESGILATNQTLFSIGSISKSFGATIIVKILNEQFPQFGEAVLDTPIVQLAPRFNFTLSDRFRSEYATFRDLLSHRICLRSLDLDLLFSTVNRTEYSFRTRYQTEGCTIRNGFVYNNALYSLVGEIIANIANSTIEQLVMDFMQSIGMTEATYFDIDESYLDLPTMSSSYYRKDNITYLYNNTLLKRVHIGLTAGGILASATDMAKYLKFHLNKGNVNGLQLIPEETMSWIYQVSNPIEFEGGKQNENDTVGGTYGYGLGFDLLLYDGYKTIGHGGYWPPFHSYLSFVPPKDTGIFTVTNGPGAILYAMWHEALHSAIYDILAGTLKEISQLSLAKYYKIQSKFGSMELREILHKTKTTVANSLAKLAEVRKQAKEPKSFASQEELVGLYGNANSGDLTITMPNSEGLQLNFGEWAIGTLTATDSTNITFVVEWLTEINQHHYTYGDLLPPPTILVDFTILNTAVIIFEDDNMVPFVRNRTLDLEPVIPWPGDSCGPIELY